MPELQTRIARKIASCAWPNARVATPAASRIRLKIVNVFATTMLLYERLEPGGVIGRAASLRSASCCVSPAAAAVVATPPVSQPRRYAA